MDSLYLTIHRQWFDEIAAGRKTIDFRRDTPFWRSRLAGRTYRTVRIRNGYRKDAAELVAEFLGCRKDGELFTIRIGDILQIKNHQELHPKDSQPHRR